MSRGYAKLPGHIAPAKRPLVGPVVLALLLGGCLGAASGRAATEASRLAVLGFQSENSPQRLIDRNASSLTVVGVDGVDLSGPGLVSAPDGLALGQQARARADGLPAVLLVSNWSQTVNDFSERLAHRTLRSPTAVADAASELAHDVLGEGWNGVSVDLESLAPRDRAGLTQFLADLLSSSPTCVPTCPAQTR